MWGDACIIDERNAGCYEDGYFEGPGCGGTCTEGDCELHPVEHRLEEEWRLASVTVQPKRATPRMAS